MRTTTLSAIDDGHAAHAHWFDTADFFAAMPYDVRSELRRQASQRTLRRNEVIFNQGDTPSALYVVETGRVAIAAQAGKHRESVLAVLAEGALFGELALFDGAPRSATARALSDTLLIELAYEPVRAMLDTQPALLWGVVRLLAQRLRRTDEALIDTVFLDVSARTSKRLLDLAGADDSFTLPVTQEELASMVGATRERVNKALSGFVQRGWLEIQGRNRYRILDRAALEARSHEN